MKVILKFKKKAGQSFQGYFAERDILPDNYQSYVQEGQVSCFESEEFFYVRFDDMLPGAFRRFLQKLTILEEQEWAYDQSSLSIESESVFSSWIDVDATTLTVDNSSTTANKVSSQTSSGQVVRKNSISVYNRVNEPAANMSNNITRIWEDPNSCTLSLAMADMTDVKEMLAKLLKLGLNKEAIEYSDSNVVINLNRNNDFYFKSIQKGDEGAFGRHELYVLYKKIPSENPIRIVSIKLPSTIATESVSNEKISFEFHKEPQRPAKKSLMGTGFGMYSNKPKAIHDDPVMTPILKKVKEDSDFRNAILTKVKSLLQTYLDTEKGKKEGYLAGMFGGVARTKVAKQQVAETIQNGNLLELTQQHMDIVHCGKKLKAALTEAVNSVLTDDFSKIDKSRKIMEILQAVSVASVLDDKMGIQPQRGSLPKV